MICGVMLRQSAMFWAATMTTSRFNQNPLSATYMTQDEANEVMELWSERQREEAARQSLITVHDVAEATQLSAQDVERLLQEVRSARPQTARQLAPMPRLATSQPNEPTLLEAYIRLAPLTGVLSGFLWWILTEQMRYSYMYGGPIRVVTQMLALYTFGIVIAFVPKYFRRWNEERISRLIRSRDRGVDSYGIR